jgi:hypothetical protein
MGKPYLALLDLIPSFSKVLYNIQYDRAHKRHMHLTHRKASTGNPNPKIQKLTSCHGILALSKIDNPLLA